MYTNSLKDKISALPFRLKPSTKKALFSYAFPILGALFSSNVFASSETEAQVAFEEHNGESVSWTVTTTPAEEVKSTKTIEPAPTTKPSTGKTAPRKAAEPVSLADIQAEVSFEVISTHHESASPVIVKKYEAPAEIKAERIIPTEKTLPALSTVYKEPAQKPLPVKTAQTSNSEVFWSEEVVKPDQKSPEKKLEEPKKKQKKHKTTTSPIMLVQNQEPNETITQNTPSHTPTLTLVPKSVEKTPTPVSPQLQQKWNDIYAACPQLGNGEGQVKTKTYVLSPDFQAPSPDNADLNITGDIPFTSDNSAKYNNIIHSAEILKKRNIYTPVVIYTSSSGGSLNTAFDVSDKITDALSDFAPTINYTDGEIEEVYSAGTILGSAGSIRISTNELWGFHEVRNHKKDKTSGKSTYTSLKDYSPKGEKPNKEKYADLKEANDQMAAHFAEMSEKALGKEMGMTLACAWEIIKYRQDDKGKAIDTYLPGEYRLKAGINDMIVDLEKRTVTVRDGDFTQSAIDNVLTLAQYGRTPIQIAEATMPPTKQLRLKQPHNRLH